MEQFAKGIGEIGPVLPARLRAELRDFAVPPGELQAARNRRRWSGMRVAQGSGPDGIQAAPCDRHGHDRIVQFESVDWIT